MRLDRNENPDGCGKYALLKLRRLENYRNGTFQALHPSIVKAIETLEREGILDWGARGTESEFMVIRLKDKYAQGALLEYAAAAERDGDTEWGQEIREMASRAGSNSQWCKKPD